MMFLKLSQFYTEEKIIVRLSAITAVQPVSTGGSAISLMGREHPIYVTEETNAIIEFIKKHESIKGMEVEL
jgi:hypothetical protein